MPKYYVTALYSLATADQKCIIEEMYHEQLEQTFACNYDSQRRLGATCHLQIKDLQNHNQTRSDLQLWGVHDYTDGRNGH